MAEPEAADQVIRILVRPIDVTARGSALEWRELKRVQVRLIKAEAAATGANEPFLEYMEAIDERNALIKARAYTEDGSDLEAAWNDLSVVDLHLLFHELLVGGAPVVPKLSEPS